MEHKGKKGRAAPRRIASLLTAAAVFLLYIVSSDALRPGDLRLDGLRSGGLSLLTALALEESPWITASPVAEADAQPEIVQSSEPTETDEGTVIDPSHTQAAETSDPAADNGVPAKTITPASRDGYLIWENVFVTNTSVHTPDLNALMQERPAAVFTDELPQVLILHTHGTESYTMPQGFAYNEDGATRTTDTDFNVVRVGDEIADVFEEAGISVLHDRTLYDAAGYKDAYQRAEPAILAYLQKYPTIHFVLDIHRDAIEDKEGNAYKVISNIDGKNAAQLTFVIGTDGSGLTHDKWKENLKLAVLLQKNINNRYPTLMRPIYLRNSRYNEHATTGSLLLEVGAAGNSLDEALYAARLFANAAVETFETLR